MSYVSATIFNNLDLEFTPPTATEGFPLGLVLKIKDSLFIFVWVLSISLLAAIYPVYKVIKLKIIEVIKYV